MFQLVIVFLYFDKVCERSYDTAIDIKENDRKKAIIKTINRLRFSMSITFKPSSTKVWYIKWIIKKIVLHTDSSIIGLSV